MKRVRAVLFVATATAMSLAAATPTLRGWLADRDGAALYEGTRALTARLQGHEATLPPQATRCTNCHQGAQAIAPALDAAGLARMQPRRGGPPSRYDAATLCRALREGIDPAHVTLPRAMPRYELTDADCAALWAHLSRR